MTMIPLHRHIGAMKGFSYCGYSWSAYLNITHQISYLLGLDT